MTEEHDMTDDTGQPVGEADTGPLPPAADDGPVDDAVWADDDASAAADEDVWADDGEDADAAAFEPAPRDPLAHALLVFALSLVVVLVATTGALYFYLSALNKAPRTVAERDVSSSEALVSEEPTNTTAWARLAYAYAEAERTDDALDALDRARAVDSADALIVVRADVLRLGGRYREAVTEYDRALTATAKLRERIRAERAKKGITREVVPDDSLLQVYWGRGLTKKELGDTTGAIADLELATKENERQVDIWVALGDLHADAGNTAKAEEAYRTALRYVPDFEAALAGLERLGKE